MADLVGRPTSNRRSFRRNRVKHRDLMRFGAKPKYYGKFPEAAEGLATGSDREPIAQGLAGHSDKDHLVAIA